MNQTLVGLISTKQPAPSIPFALPSLRFLSDSILLPFLAADLHFWLELWITAGFSGCLGSNFSPFHVFLVVDLAAATRIFELLQPAIFLQALSYQIVILLKFRCISVDLSGTCPFWSLLRVIFLLLYNQNPVLAKYHHIILIFMHILLPNFEGSWSSMIKWFPYVHTESSIHSYFYFCRIINTEFFIWMTKNGTFCFFKKKVAFFLACIRRNFSYYKSGDLDNSFPPIIMPGCFSVLPVDW